MSNPFLSKGHLGPRDSRPGADFDSIQLIPFKRSIHLAIAVNNPLALSSIKTRETGI